MAQRQAGAGGSGGRSHARHRGRLSEGRWLCAQHWPRSMSPAEEWVRPVMKRDKQVLLHWGYYPDR